jgi:pyridinium-3,5-biscarboxylic acid mononucleotide synthase
MEKPETPLQCLGFATVDTDRLRRCGIPEVIYGAGKTPEQILAIAQRLHNASQAVLATRLSPEAASLLAQHYPHAERNDLARTVVIREHTPAPEGHVAIVTAGTTDLPAAEEAAVTCAFMDARVERYNDVGVAGIHRLMDRLPSIREAHVVIAVAGMEGALPSVLGGLVEQPLIALPTRVGYGMNLNGLAALLAMLNSCAAGITVVNVDNGFGAGVAAAKINRLAIAGKR